MRLFLRQGSVIVSAGLALGVLTALAAGRLIVSQLVGVTARDLLAIWWPARRAATTDPVSALKPE